ncbi:MAG: hypothetical protein NVS2B16_22760 [Chloroflexota bacterium]
MAIIRRSTVTLMIFMVLVPSFDRPAGPEHARLFFATGVARQRGTAFAPVQIQTAYNYSPLYRRGIDGSGQIVALLEVDAFNRADIQEFDRRYGLPDAAITDQYVGGSAFNLENGGEATMDIEWVHALAPGASIHVYYVKNTGTERQGWRAVASALRTAASHGAGTISISLNACGPGSGFSATARALADLARMGVTVFVSSGDSGPHPGPVADCGKHVGVAYPASDPSVVSVGGTSLSLGPDQGIAQEIAWRRSGGGRGTRMARSAWQTARQIPVDHNRWVPDVAFVGDPWTGVSVYYQGTWRQAGGTSVGAPAWAAAWALILQNAQKSTITVGAAPALLYRLANAPTYGRDFHDITRGGNRYYRAGIGWDALTGLGTPDVASLATAVQSLSNMR